MSETYESDNETFGIKLDTSHGEKLVPFEGKNTNISLWGHVGSITISSMDELKELETFIDEFIHIWKE